MGMRGEGRDFGAKPEFPSSSALGFSVLLRKRAPACPTPYLHRHFLPATKTEPATPLPLANQNPKGSLKFPQSPSPGLCQISYQR